MNFVYLYIRIKTVSLFSIKTNSTMRKLLLLIACFIFVGNLFVSAEDDPKPKADRTKVFADADTLFKMQAYDAAIPVYKKLATKSKEDKGYGYYQIARCYQNILDNNNASQWYAKAITEGYNEPEMYMYYGQSLRQLAKYDEAIQQYNTYLGLVPSSKEAKTEIEECKLSKDWINTRTRYSVENMERFNTKESDFAASLYKNNGIMITSDRSESTGKKSYIRTGEKYTDIYESFIDNKGNWSKPSLLQGGVNSPSNDGVCSFTAKTGRMMYFTRCDANAKEGGCKIYMSKKAGADWDNAVAIKLFGDSVIVGQPYLTDKGKTMYFTALNAPGGYGGRDIWMVTGQDDKWGEPVNLGPNVNTDKDEMFPYVHEDGTLYFSSDGHLGMGGLDIFTCAKQGNNYGKALNLKAPLNSGADDFAFIANTKKTKGFLSSNRAGGKGNDDVWQWTLEPLLFNVEVTAIDDSTNRPIADAEVKLIKADNTYVDGKTDKNGKITFKLLENTPYTLQVDKPKYFGNQGTVSTLGLEFSKDFKNDIRLKPIPPLPVIQLTDILYDLASDKLRPESYPSLDSLATILLKAPNFKVGINSHTDARGTSESNIDLSQRRAQSVVNYLVSKGIDTDRLVATGYGETRLLNKCADGVECTEEEHQVNRRTEFEILSTEFKGKIIYKRVTGEDQVNDSEKSALD